MAIARGKERSTNSTGELLRYTIRTVGQESILLHNNGKLCYFPLRLLGKDRESFIMRVMRNDHIKTSLMSNTQKREKLQTRRTVQRITRIAGRFHDVIEKRKKLLALMIQEYIHPSFLHLHFETRKNVRRNELFMCTDVAMISNSNKEILARRLLYECIDLLRSQCPIGICGMRVRIQPVPPLMEEALKHREGEGYSTKPPVQSAAQYL